MNAKTVMDEIIGMSKEIGGMDYEIESSNAIFFLSVPHYRKEGGLSLKYSAIYMLHSRLAGIGGLTLDISEAEDSDDGRDMLYVQIEVI